MLLCQLTARFTISFIQFLRLITLKNSIHSFPVWRSAHRERVENNPASLLVVSLGKALNGMPPSSGGGAKQSTRRGGPV